MLIAAAVLESDGHEVKFIDGPAEDIDRDETERRIQDFAPECAVIHTTTPSVYNDLGYAEMIKQHAPECVTVAIGPHVTAEPEDTEPGNGTGPSA